jgi:hypothetical protein
LTGSLDVSGRIDSGVGIEEKVTVLLLLTEFEFLEVDVLDDVHDLLLKLIDILFALVFEYVEVAESKVLLFLVKVHLVEFVGEHLVGLVDDVSFDGSVKYLVADVGEVLDLLVEHFARDLVHVHISLCLDGELAETVLEGFDLAEVGPFDVYLEDFALPVGELDFTLEQEVDERRMLVDVIDLFMDLVLLGFEEGNDLGYEVDVLVLEEKDLLNEDLVNVLGDFVREVERDSGEELIGDFGVVDVLDLLEVF